MSKLSLITFSLIEGLQSAVRSQPCLSLQLLSPLFSVLQTYQSLSSIMSVVQSLSLVQTFATP